MAQDTVTLAAGQQRTEKVSGRFFTVISATAKFTVELDGRARREVRAGSKISAEAFKRISFIETEGIANTIIYDAGDEQYDGEVQVSGVSNETFDYPYLMPASGAELNVTGTKISLPLVITINGVKYTRKSFHIVQTTASNWVGIYAMTGELLDEIFGGTERTFYFNQDVQIARIGSTNCGIALYYTFYNTTPQ